MLARRLLSSVSMPSGNAPFAPFPSAIYAARASSRSAAINLFRVTWNPSGATVTFGPTITRTGMTRVLYGLPVRSSLNKVALLGLDAIATPVPATAHPSSDYPAPDGPELPYALSQLSTESTTITGSLTNTVQNSAYANNANNAKQYKYGAYLDPNGAISIRAGSDTITFKATATDIAQFNNIVSNYSQNPHTVAYTGSSQTKGPTTQWLGIIPASAYTAVANNNDDTVNALYVDGNDVTKEGYTLNSYPATNWWTDFSGSESFNGTQSSGPHSMTWQYTSQWAGINILQYDSTHREMYFWNSSPTRGVSTSGAWNMVVGTTTETATYSIVLPVAPTIVSDPSMTLGLYDLSQDVSDSPSTTIDATDYYVASHDTYEGYTAISPANALGGVQPILPADATTASVPWYQGDSSVQGESDKFQLPTGKIVKAATVVNRDFTTGSGFHPYSQANVSAAAATTANVAPAVTDTCGTRLVTATYNSTARTYALGIEDPEAGSTWTLAVAATAYFNTGDAVVWFTQDATQSLLFPTVFSKSPPVDAFSQQSTTAGSITYAIDPTLLYAPSSPPLFYTADSKPQPIAISGLPGNGLDPLYDAPEDGLNVGRSVAMTATPGYLGSRNGTAFFSISGTSTWCELVPISSVGTLQEASETWQGSTVKRVGVKKSVHTFAGFVGVEGSVATVYPLSGSVATTWYDVGQIVDGGGNATGTYVSWSNPGQAWTRATVASGGSQSYGSSISLTCLYSAAGKDWILGAGNAQVDLAAAMAAPGGSGLVHAITAPSAAPYLALVLPHVSGLLYSSGGSSPTYMISLDAGATWESVTVSGTPSTGGGGGPTYWPGQPLWAY